MLHALPCILCLAIAGAQPATQEVAGNETSDDGSDEPDVVARPPLTAQQRRGLRIGGYSLLIGAAAAQATSLAFKGIATPGDIAEARAVERGTSDCSEESDCLAGRLVNPMTGLGFVAAAALGGGGMHLLGRLRADRDLAGGLRWGGATTSMTVGGSLLIGGLVALTSTQLAAFGVENLLRRVRLVESGWYMFAILVPAGALALGHGHGYLRRMGISRRDARIQVVPSFGAINGVSMAGRF
jgi:hypothetical protein